jgi:hypothetical protein
LRLEYGKIDVLGYGECLHYCRRRFACWLSGKLKEKKFN